MSERPMRPDRRLFFAVGALASALGAATPLGGCQLVGGMAASYQRTGSHTVYPEYEGLVGKSFAVVVAADRTIQSNSPRLVSEITAAVTTRLVAEAGASGYVPWQKVIEYQLHNPQWAALGYQDLADHFGVDRIILVDLYEFRLNEPGNLYLWDGVAAAMVGVAEADSAFPDEFVFTKQFSVAFPNVKGTGPAELTGQQVAMVLRSRLVDRVAWLFYEHEEKNVMDY